MTRDGRATVQLPIDDPGVPAALRIKLTAAREAGARARAASYGDANFLEVRGRRGPRVGSICLERLMQRDPQGLEERVARRFLAVHAGHFLNPADPPVTILFDNCCVFAHRQIIVPPSFFFTPRVRPRPRAAMASPAR